MWIVASLRSSSRRRFLIFTGPREARVQRNLNIIQWLLIFSAIYVVMGNRSKELPPPVEKQ